MTNRQDCFYCTKDRPLQDLMTEICPLEVSTLYLNKDQTHKGRSIVAFNKHVDELFQLSQSELQLFMEDVALAAKILKETYHADKINYAIYGDLVSHVHYHLVPKYKNKVDWGEAFTNSPKQKLFEKEDIFNKRIAELKNIFSFSKS